MNKRVKASVVLVLSMVMLCGCSDVKDEAKNNKSNKTEVSDNNNSNNSNENATTENKEESEGTGSSNEASQGEDSGMSVIETTDGTLKYNWNGSYYLKNGTGDLVITQKDENSFEFKISGKNDGDDKKIEETTGVATIDEDFATYKYEDGRVISFFIVAGSSIEVSVYNNDTEEFVGAYLPQ